MINKYFQHHKMGCVQLAWNKLGITIIVPIFSLIWVGNSAYDSRLPLPPPPQCPKMKMKCVFLAAWFQQGVTVLSGQCILALHFVKQHNDVIASRDEVCAEC